MGWKDLVETLPVQFTVPWLGGRTVHTRSRQWRLVNPPRDHGWYRFTAVGREVRVTGPRDPDPAILYDQVTGYLVGDRVVPDGAQVDPDPAKVTLSSERVHLIEPGLDRFCRVRAGRGWEDGPLVYCQQEMPLGPEQEVSAYFLDGARSVAGIHGVTPALDAAFRMELHQRDEAERRRRELEELRRREEAQRVLEERRRQLTERLGDGAGRREMARIDFGEAARAALAVGGAELLDHRAHVRRGEHVVRYRLMGRRFECVCDDNLRIIDAGICLNDYESGEKGDRLFTLESISAVVRQADREGVLVVFRHV